jgi:8-oxo-dGTP diphosphatase
MPLLLVRHAVALSRRKWEGDDEQRPLSKRGHRQALAIADRLGGYPVERVLSSPAVRCIETVTPLAAAFGLSVERCSELAEGSTEAAVQLVRDLTGRTVVLCSHGDVIPRVLETLVVHDHLDLGDRPEWAKGSTWVVEDDGAAFVRAFHIEAPS